MSSKPENLITTRLTTSRNEWVSPGKYVIDPVPDSLVQELADYEIWSTKVVNRDRPDKLKKRKITFLSHRGTLLRAAGFLVNLRRVSVESICLSALSDPDNAIAFIDWYVEKQGRFTTAAAMHLARLTALARYLSITAQAPKHQKIFEHRVTELRKYRKTLG